MHMYIYIYIYIYIYMYSKPKIHYLKYFGGLLPSSVHLSCLSHFLQHSLFTTFQLKTIYH